MHTFNMPLDALLRIGSEWTPSFESIKRSLRSVFSSHQIRLDRGWECATEPSWVEALAVLAVCRFQMRRDPRVIHTCSKLVAKAAWVQSIAELSRGRAGRRTLDLVVSNGLL